MQELEGTTWKFRQWVQSNEDFIAYLRVKLWNSFPKATEHAKMLRSFTFKEENSIKDY